MHAFEITIRDHTLPGGNSFAARGEAKNPPGFTAPPLLHLSTGLYEVSHLEVETGERVEVQGR